MESPPGKLLNSARAGKPKHLPTVLTRDEVRRAIARLAGLHKSIAQLLYGSGLRLFSLNGRRLRSLP
jgi:integrase